MTLNIAACPQGQEQGQDQAQDVLNTLCEQLSELQNLRAQTSKQIINIEQQILKIVGAKEEGSMTVHTDAFKIMTTGKLNRTITLKEIDELNAVLPPMICERIYKLRPTVDLTQLRYIEQNEPEYAKVIHKHITTKPAKTSVKVEPIA